MNAKRLLNGAAVAVSLSIAAHHAGASPVDPDKLPKVDCSQLVYSQQFLAKYPKAPAACQEARVYKGKRYAKFSGKVYLNSPTGTTVQFFNVAGDPLSTLTVKPSPTAKIMINGETKTYADLKQGDPVTFWVSEKQYAVYSSPGSKSHTPIVAPQT